MGIINLISTGTLGSNKAVVRLNQCGLGHFRISVVLLGHKLEKLDWEKYIASMDSYWAVLPAHGGRWHQVLVE